MSAKEELGIKTILDETESDICHCNDETIPAQPRYVYNLSQPELGYKEYICAKCNKKIE